MQAQKTAYRKNFLLIIIFLVLIFITFVVSLFISYSLTAKYVENEFASKKIEVLEQTIKPYNDFFSNKIPEIQFYGGFLDSVSARKYALSVFNEYQFVKKVVFYDVQIGTRLPVVYQGNNLDISVKAIYVYGHQNGKIWGARKNHSADETDFIEMAAKLRNYIAFSDTTRAPSQDETYKTFWSVKPNKITYTNTLRPLDVKNYRELLRGKMVSAPYKQNMMTFYLDPVLLKVKNTHHELYQHVSIQPVVYDPIDNDGNKLITEAPFPGALSDYKLFFSSQAGYLTAETNRRFMPICAAVLVITLFLVAIGWLIYRNLNVNIKLFKLQYDFINNFTHEFKTPVSVIKIAGSNLKGDGELTERQRKHYGKILDEEADKLNDLMNKLLSFTQLENKSINIKKEEVVVADFVERYIDTFKIKYPDFKLNYTSNGVKTFYTDPVLLGSVFQNLIENAYKYSHPKRKELNINIIQKKGNILFSFIDKGIGIPRNEQHHVFKKFYRIENQYNQNGSVGLGLAFCKELVNFMNGEITVNSKINEGSEFIVTLPNEN
jgi:two-component system phosphate regulon sensor histidine kinase PhoR